MKRFILLTILGASGMRSYAQQTDPTLTGAWLLKSELLKKIFSDREKDTEQNHCC